MEQIKLLFIVASFEQGKDGIADYTAALAAACVKKGCSCTILAWNDTHLNDGKAYRSIECANGAISVLRLSSGLDDHDKKIAASKFTDFHRPTHVSIQMVCFGYHPRGWIFGLGKQLMELLPHSVHVQIMFHELWLGMAANHPLKEKMYGLVQFQALKQFYKTVSPTVVHVGNNVYYSKLALLKWPVRYLPIPSNISINEVNDQLESNLYKELSVEKEKRDGFLILLLFGSLHSGWDMVRFFTKMESIREGRKIIVVSVGSQGYGKPLWEAMCRQQNEKLVFRNLGYRSDTEISVLLQLADAGISTTPLSLLGKSGTAMAMIEHGLPVIVTRNELQFNFHLKEVEEKYKSVFYWENLQSVKELKKNPVILNKIDQIASSFLNDIKH